MTVAAKDLPPVQAVEAEEVTVQLQVNSWPRKLKRAPKSVEHLEQKAAKIFGHVRPCLRGVPDCFASAASVPAAAFLVAHARGPLSTLAAAVFGISVFMMFTISAIYHTIVWPVHIRLALRKVDHSMVFCLIAGSYTPLCLTALPQEYGMVMLCIVWAIAILGALKVFLWDDAPRGISTGMYIAMGWLVIPTAPIIYSTVEPSSWQLLLIGGILYTIGGLVFQRKWPDPYPMHWGHHEIFHVFVIAAVCCHYCSFWMMVTNPPLPGTMASPIDFGVNTE